MDSHTSETDMPEILSHQGALQKSLAAGQWFLIDTIAQKILIFGAFFVTARLLTPADFGLIALATIYPGLLDSLTAVAFETAITQKKSGGEKTYLDVVWTFNLIRMTVLFCFIFFTAPLVAHFFHANDTILLFRVSGLILFFQGWTNIGQIYFFRDLNFKKIFIRDMVNYGTTAVVSVIGALLLHSYWALFIGNATGILATTIATYFLSDHRPHIDAQFKKLKPLMAYSQWVFGQGIISRLVQTTEDTLMGHFASTTSIGLYGKAKTLARTPTSPLGNIIGKIGFSALVKVQDSTEHIREGFHKSFDLTASIALPFLVAIFIAGDQLIRIILGASWEGIIPFIKLLTIVATLDAFGVTIGGFIFNALDKPKLVIRLNILALASMIILLPILIPSRGAFGAAVALLITSIITNVYAFVLINRVVRPNFSRIRDVLGITGLSLLFPSLIVSYLLRFPFTHSVFAFTLLCIGGGISYGCALILSGVALKRGPYKTLHIIGRSFIRKHK